MPRGFVCFQNIPGHFIITCSCSLFFISTCLSPTTISCSINIFIILFSSLYYPLFNSMLFAFTAAFPLCYCAHFPHSTNACCCALPAAGACIFALPAHCAHCRALLPAHLPHTTRARAHRCGTRSCALHVFVTFTKHLRSWFTLHAPAAAPLSLPSAPPHAIPSPFHFHYPSSSRRLQPPDNMPYHTTLAHTAAGPANSATALFAVVAVRAGGVHFTLVTTIPR